jgi:hypothetical protein
MEDICAAINNILDDKDCGSGEHDEPWNTTRKRLLALCLERDTLKERNM